jgi:hypothetical protein
MKNNYLKFRDASLQKRSLKEIRSALLHLCMILLVLISTNVSAQGVLKIPSGADLSLIINADTTATGEFNERIYELERNGFYQVSRELNKIGTKLHIRGASGEGFLPAIFPKQAAGGAWPSVIIHAGDLTLENLYISNQNGAQDKWRGTAITAANARVEITNCHIENERGAGFMLSAPNASVFIRDSRFSKMGQRTDPGGNGRAIDTRGHDVDTLVIQNSTIYLVMDRVLRTQGGTIDYLEWDHTTVFNHMGRFGFLQLGRVTTAKITNNLFINSQLMGDNPLGLAEQTQPENSNVYMMTIDAIVDGMQMEVRNNNFGWSQEIIDFWNSNADTLKPDIMTASIKDVIGQDALASAYFEEYVEFTNAPAFPMNYLNALFADTQPDPMPQWMESDNVGIAFVNCAYADTYDSYTAADRGFPLGDLNHFPELKQIWEQGGSVGTNDFDGNFNTVKVFPNPAKDMVHFSSQVDEVFLFNITGKLVAYKQHVTSVSLDGMSKGIYLLRARVGGEMIHQKLMVY